jgi:hypothetical protein
LRTVSESTEENRDGIMMVPVEFKQRTQILRGMDRSGNVVNFDIYDCSDSQMGVRITTCWN